MAKESMFGGFVKGAISMAIIAGIGLALFGAAPVVFAALTGKAALTGAALLTGIKGAFTATSMLWAIGGGALLGGATRVMGNAIRERQAAAEYEASVERGQAISSPGRARSQQHDYGAMGEAAGMNYRNDWAARAKGGAGVNAPGV